MSELNNGSQEKRVNKVVTTNVKVKKKSEIHRLSDIFLAEDMSSVGNYILMDVLIPAAKKALSDIVKDGIDMILYGSTGHSKKAGNKVSYVSYDKMSDRRDDVRARTSYGIKNITFDSRGEAEEVLMNMEAIIDTYDTVSIADMYDLVGVSGNYTDRKYGWTNLRNAKVVRVSDGYQLDLPKALPL